MNLRYNYLIEHNFYPSYNTIQYENIITNEDIKNIIKFIYVYFKDNWLKDPKFGIILNLLYKNDDGNIKIIPDSRLYNKYNIDDDKIIDEKIKYITTEIINIRRLKKILEKYINIYDIEWYDLKKNETLNKLKKYIFKILKKYLLNKII